MQQRKEERLKKRMEEQLEKCTFKPDLTKGSKTKNASLKDEIMRKPSAQKNGTEKET